MKKQQLMLAQVDEELAAYRAIKAAPPGGWLATVREALGMPAIAAAARAGITAAGWYDAERREAAGGITLKTLSDMADALGCRVTYALVPRESLEGVVMGRVKEIARAETERARKTMALEGQAPSAKHLAYRTKLREDELFLSDNWPSDLWRR